MIYPPAENGSGFDKRVCEQVADSAQVEKVDALPNPRAQTARPSESFN